MTTACHFCGALVENDETRWLQFSRQHPRYHACPEHWAAIAEHGVTFDANGVPELRRPTSLSRRPAGGALRFLPLIEQLYAREWLLERLVDAYRCYVDVLEGDPSLASEADIEQAAATLNEALDALKKGPVQGGGQ